MHGWDVLVGRLGLGLDGCMGWMYRYGCLCEWVGCLGG